MKKWILWCVATVLSLTTSGQLQQFRVYVDGNEAQAQTFDATGEFFEGTFTIETNGLTPGMHRLYVEVKDANGVWSLYAQELFNLTHSSSTATLNVLEYFFDVDPGFGNGVDIAVSGNDFSGNLSIATTGLTPGIHRLYVRSRDSAGLWSLYATHIVELTQGGEMHVLEQAEYFFDTDPGFGNGIALDLENGDFVNASFPITVQENLELGSHVVYIRTKDTSGQWSLYATDTLTICDMQLPVLTDSGDQCLGGEQTIAVSGDDYTSFTWNDSSTNDSLVVSASGSYSVLVEKNGCYSEVMTEVMFIELETPSITLSDGILYAGGKGDSYQWFLNDVLIEGATSSSYDPNENGNYTVALFDNNCSIVSEIFVYTSESIEEIPIRLSVYPNPASQAVTIEYLGNYELRIYAITGQLIHQSMVYTSKIQVLTNEWANGMYIVECISDVDRSTVLLEVNN